MMKLTGWKALASGAAGAIVLNLLHEATKRAMPHAPRLDVLGMRAIAKIARIAGIGSVSHLHDKALTGDLGSNAAYYSLVSAFGPQHAVTGGALLGLAAGVGSITLPQEMGLGSAPSARTPQTAAASVGLYVAGGIAAGAVYKALNRD